MLLSPKRTAFRKSFKCRVGDGIATRGYSLAFGEYGLKAITAARVTAQQIEAARKAMMRILKKHGCKLIIRIFPDQIQTKKPAETRMGGGKGNPEIWCVPVLPGCILFEVQNANLKACTEAFALASAKLPVRTIITSREGKGEL